MLRKLAVALIAATVFTAPALAQSATPANPPASAATKTDTAPAPTPPATATTTTPATTPAVVAAKPTLKSAKVRHGRRLAHHVKRVKHAKHAKLVERMKHVKHVTHVKRAKLVKHARHIKHVQPVKHVKAAKHLKIAKAHGTRHVRHLIRKSTTARSDAPAAPKSVNESPLHARLVARGRPPKGRPLALGARSRCDAAFDRMSTAPAPHTPSHIRRREWPARSAERARPPGWCRSDPHIAAGRRRRSRCAATRG